MVPLGTRGLVLIDYIILKSLLGKDRPTVLLIRKWVATLGGASRRVWVIRRGSTATFAIVKLQLCVKTWSSLLTL